jgi:hypothetical protein
MTLPLTVPHQDRSREKTRARPHVKQIRKRPAAGSRPPFATDLILLGHADG